VGKSIGALARTSLSRLVVAGGVGANLELRQRLTAAVERRGGSVFFPDLAFCTDNGAMIALVGALRMSEARLGEPAFSVKPRWDLASLAPAWLAPA
jgi:N6-L-threonylcarbamoyladenine synthase